jgi:hypothetical protein
MAILAAQGNHCVMYYFILNDAFTGSYIIHLGALLKIMAAPIVSRVMTIMAALIVSRVMTGKNF